MDTLLTLAQATDPWANEFFGLDRDQRFVILIIGISCITAILITTVAVVAGVFGSMHRRNQEAALKRELLDRGMSADEIARVVEATPPQDFIERWTAACGKKKTG